jgi:ribosome-associated toxin RatA of RatAB toxin-antitoxin module
MPEIERSALVEYSPEQMFNLVNDIEKYPEFLPGCIAAEVSERTAEKVVGTLDLQKGPIRQRFSTINTLYGSNRMDMELADGPLEHLKGQWIFTPLGKDPQHAKACKIEFKLSFAFKNAVMGIAFNGFITDLASTMVDSFTQRANVVYSQESSK